MMIAHASGVMMIAHASGVMMIAHALGVMMIAHASGVMMIEKDGVEKKVTTRWKYFRMDPKAFMTMGILKVRCRGAEGAEMGSWAAGQEGVWGMGVDGQLNRRVDGVWGRMGGSACMQVRFFMEFMRGGFDVLCADLDVIWLKDLIPSLNPLSPSPRPNT